MKTLTFALLCVFCTMSGAFAQREYDSLYGKPLIVLIESNPWLMVVGSDVPSFALYENGQVIYKVMENKSVKTYEAKLTKEEIEQTIKKYVHLMIFIMLKRALKRAAQQINRLTR